MFLVLLLRLFAPLAGVTCAWSWQSFPLGVEKVLNWDTSLQDFYTLTFDLTEFTRKQIPFYSISSKLGLLSEMQIPIDKIQDLVAR